MQASIKRTFKFVLQMLKKETTLGEPLNFKTIKDKLVIEAIYAKYDAAAETENIPVDEIRRHLSALGSIRSKRS